MTTDTVTIELPANDFRLRSLRHLLVLQALGCEVKADKTTMRQLKRLAEQDRQAMKQAAQAKEE